MKKIGDQLSTLMFARSEITMIRDFASEIDLFLEGKSPPVLEKPFTKREIGDLRKIAESLNHAANAATIQGKSKALGKDVTNLFSGTVSSSVGKFVMQAVIPLKQRGFLADMALVYLVSQLEAFCKDYLFQVLIRHPVMLRSGASMAIDEIAKYKSITQLWRGVAEREVESLGYGSIDDVGIYFQKKLSIDVCSFKKWDEMREHVFRRNIIVHNKGRINETYKRKIKGNHAHHSTDMEYVKKAASNILEFLEFIHSAVVLKFDNKKMKTSVKKHPAVELKIVKTENTA